MPVYRNGVNTRAYRNGQLIQAYRNGQPVFDLEVTFTYVTQFGTAPAAQVRAYNSSAVLPTMSVSGQAFEGWLRGSDGALIAPGTAVTATRYETFTAKWGSLILVQYNTTAPTGYSLVGTPNPSVYNVPAATSITLAPYMQRFTVGKSQTDPTQLKLYAQTGWRIGATTYSAGQTLTFPASNTIEPVWTEQALVYIHGDSVGNWSTPYYVIAPVGVSYTLPAFPTWDASPDSLIHSILGWVIDGTQYPGTGTRTITPVASTGSLVRVYDCHPYCRYWTLFETPTTVGLAKHFFVQQGGGAGEYVWNNGAGESAVRWSAQWSHNQQASTPAARPATYGTAAQQVTLVSWSYTPKSLPSEGSKRVHAQNPVFVLEDGLYYLKVDFVVRKSDDPASERTKVTWDHNFVVAAAIKFKVLL
jgi:hypothetical protein